MAWRYIGLIFLSATAVAGGADDMLSISELWLQCLVVSAILFASIRYVYWTLYLGILVVVLFGYASYTTLSDPIIGAAIIDEQGVAYAYSLYGTVVVMAAAVVLGGYFNRWAK